MATLRSASPDLSVADRLDHEIANLRAQVESLKRDLKIQTSVLITSESAKRAIRNQSTRGSKRKASEATSKLLQQAEQQEAHKQQCLYRACASITTFKIHDPDPNAVDGGSVLGIRFEVMSKARFIRPYYVMLNRPYPNSRHLRVHRHTVPPCVSLPGLAARHLPGPKPSVDEQSVPKKQDLSGFVRGLRRELVRYHNRVAVIGDLKKSVGLDRKSEQKRDRELPIADIRIADAEAKQIGIEWADGKTGRLVMDDNGGILKMAVFGETGHDRDASREFLGGSMRIEEVVKSLEKS